MRPRRIGSGLPWKSNTWPSRRAFCQKYRVLRTFAHAEYTPSVTIDRKRLTTQMRKYSSPRPVNVIRDTQVPSGSGAGSGGSGAPPSSARNEPGSRSSAIRRRGAASLIERSPSARRRGPPRARDARRC